MKLCIYVLPRRQSWGGVNRTIPKWRFGKQHVEKDLDNISGEIVNAAMKVHSYIRKYLTENAYEARAEGRGQG